MRIVTGVASDVGRVRASQQDAWVVGRGLAAVADGMGGHAAGEVASRHAVDALRDFVDEEQPDAGAVVAAVGHAHAAILEDGRRHPDRRGMGTTLTAVARVGHGDGPAWLVVNVGDSRAYRLAGGRLAQVTRDHSEVAELVAAGRLTEEQARHHPLRHVVTRALGGPAPPAPDTWLLTPEDGEAFLLCTDGLTKEVPDGLLEEVLVAETDPQVAADTLVRAALEAGGHDNVTVVVMRPAG